MSNQNKSAIDMWVQVNSKKYHSSKDKLKQLLELFSTRLQDSGMKRNLHITQKSQESSEPCSYLIAYFCVDK